MDIVIAIVLGIIEGLTEFLPISSTGHLIIAQELLVFKDTARVFTVAIQIGAIAAVVWYYRLDLWKRIRSLKRRDGRRFWINVMWACLPAVVSGVLLESFFDDHSTIAVIAGALIIGGFILLAAEKRFAKRLKGHELQLDTITPKQALGIGVVQMAALIPGVSRSGATIVGGMLAGLNRVTAAAFSFYISIPVIAGASLYKLLKNRDSLHLVEGGVPGIVAGTIAAFISALFVVSWLLRYISKHDFKPFAYYRIVLGIVLYALLLLGVITS